MEQQASGQPVLPLRQGDADLGRAAPIELAGPAATAAGLGAEPAVGRVEEALADHPIEVKGRESPVDARTGGGLIAAHLVVLSDDVLVESAPHRIRQRGDRLDLLGPVVGWHEGNSNA